MPTSSANGYLSIDLLLAVVVQPERGKLEDILEKHRALFESRPGSSHNHQAWEGGYIDHITEVGNIAHLLYGVMNEMRALPFTLSDAIVSLFLHDIEKPFKDLEFPKDYAGPDFVREKDKRKYWIIKDLLKLSLSELLMNAIFFAEGEVVEYSNTKRCMSELAAFVHMCDIASARLWYDRPRPDEAEWGRRIRNGVAACYACYEGIQVGDVEDTERGPMHRACAVKVYAPIPVSAPEVVQKVEPVRFYLKDAIPRPNAIG